MVEEFEKLNQYTYKNNASLVITRQSEGLWTRESTGDTGESRTLSTYPLQLLRSDMGSRSAYGRPVEQIQKGKARKNKKDKDRLESERVKKQHERQRETVLECDVDTSYRPTTKESRLAYEVLMKFAERIFGAQPGQMMRGLCDLLISGCKDNSMPSEKEKLKWFHENFPNITFGKDELNELMRISRGINDYGRSEVDVELDENGAIENVKWEEDEDDMYEIREKEDEGEDSGDDAFVAIEDPDRKEREKQRNEQANQQLVSNMMVDDDDDTDVMSGEREREKEKEKERNKLINTGKNNNSGGTSIGGVGTGIGGMDRSKRVGESRRKGDEHDKTQHMDIDIDEDNDGTTNINNNTNIPDINLSASKFEISPKEIDAHWLQRKVRQHFKQLDDPLTLSEKLLKALDQSNPRKVEEQLIALVEYQDWEFSKQLLRNKDIIVWCTKRKRAKDAKELQEIDTYMANDPKLCSILEELERTHGTAEARTKQFVHTIHREAKTLKQQFLKQQSSSNANNIGNMEDEMTTGVAAGDSTVTGDKGIKSATDADALSMVDNDRDIDTKKGIIPSSSTKMEIDSSDKAFSSSTAYDSSFNNKTGSKSRTDISSSGAMPAKDLSDFAQWNKIHNTKNVLDLESLAFTQGGHYMSETSWNLHSGSKSIQHKGYLEVIVPALQNKNTQQQQQQLISIKQLDEWAQAAFVDDTDDNKNDTSSSSSFTPLKSLNYIQSQCYEFAMKHSENMLVCAPTGAGKTNVALMCILREIGLRRNVATGEIDKNAFKCIYIAPMKSLVREMVLKFTEKLTKNYDIKVAEMSGDQMLTQEQLFETQIIVTTPEKWDVMTRKGMDRAYMSLVKLIVIDEIHLLHDTRGPVLESIVARTHRHIETSMDHIRLVGLSATLPNFKDVALFLRCESNGIFYFDNGYRPIPLSQRYVGITWKRAYRQYQLMNDLCYDYIMEQMTKKQQVIVFVHSRKETMNTCKYLINKCEENRSLDKVLSDDSGEMEILRTECKNVVDVNLSDILAKGFAIHHAGMSRSDRVLIEDLFRARIIKVLVSTSTLAWGVNMPAHAVIIKGTQIYDAEKGKWSELNMLDVLQMFGRAGRPPFDTYGEGILITTHPELKYYMPLLNEQMPIESQLLHKLSDVLNAEIVLGTIQHLKEAVDWLSYTYLFVRMCKNPTIYGISNEMLANDKYLLQRRIDLLHSSAIILEKCHMLKYDKNTGYLQSTDMGRVAAHYYISHESIETYNEYLRPTLSDIEILRVFSLSGEFKYISVREGEKDELSKLIDKVPIPIKESIEENASKINVLLQTYIARLKLEGFQLIADMSYITQSASRLFRCLFEMVLKRQWAQVTMRALTFCKMVAHRMWSIESPLRQFNIIRMNHSSSTCIPNLCIQRLERANMSWEGYLRLKPEEIGELIRMQELGKLVYKYIHAIPKMECKGLVQPITRSVIKVDLSLFADFEWIDEFHNNCQEFWIFVEDVDSEHILHYEYFILRKKFIHHEHHISFTIPITHPLPPQYFIRIVSDKWLGSETVLPISFRLLILPEKFKPATELLDLQPLPIKSMQLSQSLLQSIFRFEYFNAIQTQVFGNLYRTSENILLCAPINSGKTTCAEIALLKNIMEYPNCKSVYISPIEEICNYRYKEWKIKFGKNKYLNAFLASSSSNSENNNINNNICNVVLTCGDRTIDLKNIETAKIIITTPEHWDNITRRWRTRPVVQNVSLLICDDLHLIGNGSKGATYEMVVSRMRCMKEELQSPLRMIGLAVPIANASDFGLWLGAPLSHIYNFEPMVRPIPINIHFEVSDLNNFESRHMYFLKPCYLHIIRYCPNKRVIIFCPSARHCRRVAGDICAYAASDAMPYRFLRINKQDLANDKLTYTSLKNNKELWECVNRGVGYLTPYMDENKKRAVTRLFRNDCIQILVVEHSLCWGLDEYDMIEGDNDDIIGKDNQGNNNSISMEVKTKIEASMVIIMDTQYYNGSYHEYVDYSLPQIIQMMGKANHRNKIYDTNTNITGTSGSSMNTNNNSSISSTAPPSAVRCVIFCHSSKKAFLNRFLTHAFPVESALEAFIDDHLNAEIAQESISDANDAIDLLTWTYYFRRLTKNPNYYALKGVTDIELSQHLSELVEESLTGLYNAKCIHVDEEMSVEPLNYSLIAVYHYVSCHTIERMHNLITVKSQIPELLSIISSAVELEEVCSIRNNEEYAIEKMSKHLPIKISYINTSTTNNNNANINYFTEVSTKINVLLQTHFIRRSLLGAIRYDRLQILKKIYPIVCALIDMASTKKFLMPTLQSIKLSQMLIQGVTANDSPLLQLPHLDASHVQLLSQQHQIQDIFDLTELGGNQAIQILQQIGITHPQQRADIANVTNIIPNVGIQAYVLNENFRVNAGEKLKLMVRIERDDPFSEEDEEDESHNDQQILRKKQQIFIPPPVFAPRFPFKQKPETWYIVVGDSKTNRLFANKRFTIDRLIKDFTLEIDVNKTPGACYWDVHLMCDSYVGCDQKQQIQFQVFENQTHSATNASSATDNNNDHTMSVDNTVADSTVDPNANVDMATEQDQDHDDNDDNDNDNDNAKDTEMTIID